VREADLMAVVYKALRDEDFFKLLFQNVDAALDKAQIELSPEDKTALQSALKSPATRIDFDLPGFLRRAHVRRLEDDTWVSFHWIDPFKGPKP
jgi:hypothetical protein